MRPYHLDDGSSVPACLALGISSFDSFKRTSSQGATVNFGILRYIPLYKPGELVKLALHAGRKLPDAENRSC